MEKYTAHSFSRLATFAFLLYFAKVSRGSSESVRQSIIDVMRTDSELPKMPLFFNESSILKSCFDVKYPEENVAPNIISTNTLLCLTFYDTWYKVCHFNQIEILSYNSSTFDSVLQKFIPGPDDTDKTKFCNNLGGLTISYEKLKPLLSKLLEFNKPYVCFPICFDTEGHFNPLCAIVAWSKSINDNAKKLNTVKKMPPHDDVLKDAHSEAKKQKSIKVSTFNSDIAKTTRINNNSEMVKTVPSNNDNHNDNHNDNLQNVLNSPDTVNSQNKSGNLTSKPQEVAASLPLLKLKSTSTLNVKNTSLISKIDSMDIKDQKTKGKSIPPELNHKEKVSDMQTVNTPEDFEAPKNLGTSNNEHEESTKDVNDDDKPPGKIQEEYEWNPVNNGKLPFEGTDSLDQSNEPGDQNQHVAEPFEQRDTISHRIIRPDEESHIFTYFTVITLISIAAYIGYHNKQKILAIVLEGRRSRNSRDRRRPSTVNYRKLDYTLEEAVTSQVGKHVM
ncbi:uncharacterized protein LOC122401194 isoform X2 [Colletes gigas]|uniref:uncharacterized protein LOC122401194 isoform X2 n=1 Tax=Colletes gigas TaxID=935657 RepID=UPI001C9B87CD|nr:uncharacterized protein LOC122401194 isoform X2 [Colletes gigas]